MYTEPPTHGRFCVSPQEACISKSLPVVSIPHESVAELVPQKTLWRDLELILPGSAKGFLLFIKQVV